MTNVAGYGVFNGKIILLCSKGRRCTKVLIMNIRGRGSEVRLIDIIVVKKPHLYLLKQVTLSTSTDTVSSLVENRPFYPIFTPG